MAQDGGMRCRLGILVALAGCGSSSTSTPDARPADASVTVADARPADAPLNLADAGPADAPVNLADAPRIDARPPPDSGPPEDAPLPADAAPPADAQPGDAGPCIPACWTSILAGLQANCVPSGACTSGGELPTFAICYENGVKVVTTIGFEGFVVRWTTPGDTACYSIDTALEGSISTVAWKNADGETVATLSADINDPLVVQVTCGDDPPITIDVTQPGCQGGPGLPGGPDGGTTCTPSENCTP
jgi:hypothetical protein